MMAFFRPLNIAEFWNRGFVMHDLRLSEEECEDALGEVESAYLW